MPKPGTEARSAGKQPALMRQVSRGMDMTRQQAAKLRGLIQTMLDAALALHGATEAEVQAGGLDANYTAAKDKMLAYIRELTK